MNMPETFVDQFETVQIQVDHRETGGCMPLSPGQGLADAFKKQRAVRQSSQGIVQSVMNRLLLGALAIGDVGL